MRGAQQNPATMGGLRLVWKSGLHVLREANPSLKALEEGISRGVDDNG